MPKHLARAITVFTLLFAGPLGAGASDGTQSIESLRHLSQSVEALVTQVSPSVVQVLVTGYGPVEDPGRGDTDVVIGRQRSLGSGVIVDPDGFIITNAHVISGAQRVQVVVPAAHVSEPALRSLVSARGRTVEARIVGIASEVDLALLKIDLAGLPALKMANYDEVHQGQMVFAFGSPEGLRNSVTMGVISAVARQPDADHPMVYIQTDAPINHGNSGGPLVNVEGEVVGINAFILSDSGGSQGLGFAIPSAVVSVAYPQLRKYGHLHRSEIGVQVQTITPELARGLGLSKDSGLIVSDLLPEGPAEAAGLQIQDVIETIDDLPMESLLELAFHLYTRNPGERIKLVVRRGDVRLPFDLPVVERPHDFDGLGDLGDPETNRISQLGIVGIGIDETIAPLVPSLRIRSGVIVAGRSQGARGADVALSAGDIIHRLNGAPIAGLQELRTALDAIEPHGAVVLQVERSGKLSFVAFRLD
ncbi:MAG: trypsin-like peptidase domain-containing protein [Acidobacteriota bacterium]